MNKRTALRVLGLTAVAWGALALGGCSREAKTSFQGVDVTGAEYAKDIPLRDVDGKQRSLKDFAGKVVVVFFGYTQCPDVCPTTMQELVEVKQQLGADGDRLQGIFVTLDPEGTYTLDHSAGSYVYDTAGRLRVYERYGGGPQVLGADVKALLQEKRS
jgi:protein SCO1/2